MQTSPQRAERIRSLKWDHAVSEHAQLVHPGGQPISHPTKSGFNRRRESWVSLEDSSPAVEVRGAWREQREAVSIACPAINLSPTRSLPRLTDPPPIAGGVCHITLCIDSVSPCPFPFLPLAFSLALNASHASGVVPSFITCASGVAQVSASRRRHRFCVLVTDCLASAAFADAQDEQPQPLVRRANFLRRKQSRRNSEAEALEIGANSIEAERQVSGDILEEHECGLNLRNDSRDRGPKVSFIICATALAGGAERLARVAATDEIHRSTPGPAVEGSQIRPHRSRSQEARVHRLDQTADAERFPLHIAHSASTAAEREIESEVEPAASGAEREDCDVVGV